MTQPMPNPAFQGRIDDPRLGELLGKGVSEEHGPLAVLVGFPTDEGVRRNGGRTGAAAGPDALRRQLYRLTPDPRLPNHARVLARTVDLGNLNLCGDLERDQCSLAQMLQPYLAEGVVPIVLGGGHETTYGHFLAYVGLALPLSILNIDSHADVRPCLNGQGHSGSPFRQAMEHTSGLLQRYDVAGLDAATVASDHLLFISDHGGQASFREELHEDWFGAYFQQLSEPALVSMDLDAVDGSQAPGVSAPATAGLSAKMWRGAAHSAGLCPLVRSFDVVELNPTFDADGRTARLAAITVWEFLRGLAGRTAAR